MNDTKIEIPAGVVPAGSVEVEAAESLVGAQGDFEAALVALQGRVDAAWTPEAREQDLARACVRAATEGAQAAESGTGGELGDLDTPALSAYQRRATLSEVAHDVARDFESGIGADARAYLNFCAGEPVVLNVAPHTQERACVRVNAEAGDAAAASIDVVAQEGAALELVIALDATEADAGEPSLLGSELRVFAGAGARVNITVYTMGGASTTALDDSGFVLDEDARVTVRHLVLGGAVCATGLAADVRGERARIDIDTRYLASGDETRDFNYVVRQRGKKTVSNMDANGVLAGRAKKVLRGTIDLVHGCKGAEGTERETVLLANQGVDNKTVPTILCDEDDVAGNHGATIGHVRPDQLFYLGSRGISEADAEALFLRAKLEDAWISAPDERIRAAVCRLGQALVDDFEEGLA